MVELAYNGLTEHTTQVAVAVAVKELQTVAVKAVTVVEAMAQMAEVAVQMEVVQVGLIQAVAVAAHV